MTSTPRKTRSSIPKSICPNHMQVWKWTMYPSHNQVTLSLTYTSTTACERQWGRDLYELWTLGQWIVMVKTHSFEAVCYMIVDNGYQGIAGLNTYFNYGNLLFVCVPPHTQWYVCGGYQEGSFWEWVLFPSITWILAVSGTQAVSSGHQILAHWATSMAQRFHLPLCAALWGSEYWLHMRVIVGAVLSQSLAWLASLLYTVSDVCCLLK